MPPATPLRLENPWFPWDGRNFCASYTARWSYGQDRLNKEPRLIFSGLDLDSGYLPPVEQLAKTGLIKVTAAVWVDDNFSLLLPRLVPGAGVENGYNANQGCV